MNICMISQYLPNLGGIENIVSDLARRLVRNGHQVSVIAPAYEGTLPYVDEPEELDGVRIYRFARSQGYPMGIDELGNMYSLILKANQRENFDIIHAHFAKNEGLVGNKAGKKLGIPTVTTVHGSDIMDTWGGMCESAWSRFWVRKVLKDSTHLSTVSHFLKDEVVKHGVPGEKVRVIHNWIDPIEFSGAQDAGSSSPVDIPGFDSGSLFHIVTARRLVQKNGVDLLIDALDHLDGPDFGLSGKYRLHILADGPERSSLEQLVSVQGRKETVIFHGAVSYALYKQFLRWADVWVCPSRWEGFGMVLLEAFAAGTPVIGTKVGGIPEIIEHGKNGLLSDPDPKSLASCIRDMLQDESLAGQLVDEGRDCVTKYFHHSRGVREWIEYYREIIETHHVSHHH
jgi:glycosyltransferase involved in cell wall biosynthesis